MQGHSYQPLANVLHERGTIDANDTMHYSYTCYTCISIGR